MTTTTTSTMVVDVSKKLHTEPCRRIAMTKTTWRRLTSTQPAPNQIQSVSQSVGQPLDLMIVINQQRIAIATLPSHAGCFDSLVWTHNLKYLYRAGLTTKWRPRQLLRTIVVGLAAKWFWDIFWQASKTCSASFDLFECFEVAGTVATNHKLTTANSRPEEKAILTFVRRISSDGAIRPKDLTDLSVSLFVVTFACGV